MSDQLKLTAEADRAAQAERAERLTANTAARAERAEFSRQATTRMLELEEKRAEDLKAAAAAAREERRDRLASEERQAQMIATAMMHASASSSPAAAPVMHASAAAAANLLDVEAATKRYNQLFDMLAKLKQNGASASAITSVEGAVTAAEKKMVAAALLSVE
jgi:hypothetical protein